MDRARRRCPAPLIALAALAAAAPAGGEILFSGRVLGADGAPLPGAAVELVAVRGPWEAGLDALAGRLAPPPVDAAATDERGWFELEAPAPGLWEPRVAAAGHVPMAAQLLDPAVEEVALPAVTLRRDRPLELLVRGPDGLPLAGAAVFALTRSARLWHEPPTRGRRYWHRDRSRGWTDREGRVELPRAAGESLDVYAFAPGLVPARRVTESAGPIELRLERGRQVVVEVRDAEGRPVPRALVSLAADLWPAGLTDEKGRLVTAAPSAAGIRAVSALGGRGSARLAAESGTCRLTLSEPVTLVGSVVEAGSRLPIAGALVTGSSGRLPVLTDRAGRFALPVRPVDLPVHLRAAAPGYFREFGRERAALGSEPVIALEPAAAVRGEVVDERGSPVASAEVSTHPIPEPGTGYRGTWRPGRAHSRADGRFRLAAVMPGVALEIQAVAAGRAPGRQQLEPLAAHEERPGLRFVLTPGSALTGRLSSGGEPLAGAELRLLERPDSPSMMALVVRRQRGAEPVATSGEDGRFEIPNLATGSYLLRATAAGHAPLIVRGVAITEHRDTDLGTLELEPGAAIAGRVVDEGGEPVAGARVEGIGLDSLTVELTGSPFGAGGPAVTTGADGEFVLPDWRPGARVQLQVSHPDLRPVELPAVAAPTERPLRIVLRRGSRLAGSVVDPGGGPVAGARVYVTLEGDATGGETALLRHVSEPPGRADENGRFEIRNAPSGDLRLTASAEGWIPAELGGLRVAPGGEIDGLRLVLERGATVAGRVLEASGEPAAGVDVLVEQGAAYSPGTSPYTSSGDDGGYRLSGVAPGPRIIVARRSSGGTSAELEVRLGENRLDLVFPAGVEVTGRVVDAGGVPVEGAVVVLRRESGWSRYEARSGADGGFRFANVVDGRYLVRASRDGYADGTHPEPVSVASAPRGDLQVTLSRGGAVAGRLLGLEPARRAVVNVVAMRSEEESALGQVASDGSYRIHGLAPGDWTVLALIADGPRARGRVTLEAGDEARLDLDLSSGLVLSGAVRLDGRLAPGLEVALRGGGPEGWATTWTGPEGRFRLEGLEPGGYRLVVRNSHGLEHSEPLALDGDRDVLVAIETGRIAGRALDGASGAPLPGVALDLRRLAGDGGPAPSPGLERSTDAGGGFVLADVAAGDYLLRATIDGYAPAERRLSLAPGAELDLDLRLEPSDGLWLAVSGPTGAPATGISYAVLGPAGGTLAAGTRPADPSGRFRLPSVPAGRFDLLLSTPGSAVRRLTAEAPGPVAVQLEPACRLEVTVEALARQPAAATLRILDAAGRPFRELGGGRPRERWELVFGSQAVTGLPAGSYTVRVESSDGRHWEAGVDLSRGATYRLRL